MDKAKLEGSHCQNMDKTDPLLHSREWGDWAQGKHAGRGLLLSNSLGVWGGSLTFEILLTVFYSQEENK